MTTEQEKGELGAETIKDFLKQFDHSDELAQSLISILIEELMNAKVIYILSQQEQTGDQINNNCSVRFGCDISTNIDTNSTITNNISKSNPENNSR